MAANLTMIVGLAGSGKTHLCRELALDEDHAFPDVTHPAEDRRLGPRGLGEMVARLSRGENCVADEAHLAVPQHRDMFRDFLSAHLPDVKVSWIFFKRDVVACAESLMRDTASRADTVERLKSFLNQVAVYKLPDKDWDGGFEVRDVYRSGPSSISSEAEALEQIRAVV